jgi:porin
MKNHQQFGFNAKAGAAVLLTIASVGIGGITPAAAQTSAASNAGLNVNTQGVAPESPPPVLHLPPGGMPPEGMPPGGLPPFPGSGGAPPPFALDSWGMQGITPQDCEYYDKDLGFHGFVALSSPPLCGTLYPSLFGLRPTLADMGIGFQALNMASYQYDLRGHNKTPQQYGGQDPTVGFSTLLQVTYDLSRIGFTPGAQLDVQGVFQVSNFKLTGPHILGLGELAVDQPLLNGALDLRYGFIPLASNYYGLAIGGIAFGNTQGPISIIPHEVGLAFETGTPAVEAIVRPFENPAWYENFSVSEATGKDEVDDNPYGVNLKIRQSRALIANEFGYGSAQGPTWVRFGQIYNFTPQTRFKDNTDVNNDHDLYGGLTYQLTGRGNINHGLFFDIKGDLTPQDRNYYSSDIAVSLSYKGLIMSRPLDTVSVGYQYLVYSSDLKKKLEFFEHTALPADSNSYTGSYAAFVTRGMFLVSTLSYITQPVGVATRSSSAFSISESLAFSL